MNLKHGKFSMKPVTFNEQKWPTVPKSAAIPCLNFQKTANYTLRLTYTLTCRVQVWTGKYSVFLTKSGHLVMLKVAIWWCRTKKLISVKRGNFQKFSGMGIMSLLLMVPLCLYTGKIRSRRKKWSFQNVVQNFQQKKNRVAPKKVLRRHPNRKPKINCTLAENCKIK